MSKENGFNGAFFINPEPTKFEQWWHKSTNIVYTEEKREAEKKRIEVMHRRLRKTLSTENYFLFILTLGNMLKSIYGAEFINKYLLFHKLIQSSIDKEYQISDDFIDDETWLSTIDTFISKIENILNTSHTDNHATMRLRALINALVQENSACITWINKIIVNDLHDAFEDKIMVLLDLENFRATPSPARDNLAQVI